MNIIYEDQDLIIINKPFGVAVQNATTGKKDLESMLKTYLYEKYGKANPYLGVVHRLDQPVQGLVVFAKNQNSASALSKQIQNGKMKKYYHAVVCAVPEKKEDTLIHYLRKNGKTNLSEVVMEKTQGAKKAILNYKVVRELDNKAEIEIELLTGRHHQIRVQMSAAEMPLYGDQKYNPNAKRGEKIALCATRLELEHPRNSKKMVFTCEPEFEI